MVKKKKVKVPRQIPRQAISPKRKRGIKERYSLWRYKRATSKLPKGYERVKIGESVWIKKKQQSQILIWLFLEKKIFIRYNSCVLIKKEGENDEKIGFIGCSYCHFYFSL